MVFRIISMIDMISIFGVAHAFAWWLLKQSMGEDETAREKAGLKQPILEEAVQ